MANNYTNYKMFFATLSPFKILIKQNGEYLFFIIFTLIVKPSKSLKRDVMIYQVLVLLYAKDWDSKI